MYYSVSDYDTSTFNKSDDKFQEKQYKKVTRHILKIVHCKVHFQINHRRLIIIANTSILNISSKVWIYSLLVSTFIIVIVFLFLTGSRRLHWLQRWKIQRVFWTTGVLIYFQAFCVEEYDISKKLHCGYSWR